MSFKRKPLIPPIVYSEAATYFDVVYDTAIGRMRGRILAASAKDVEERIKRHLDAEIVSIESVTEKPKAGAKAEVQSRA